MIKVKNGFVDTLRYILLFGVVAFGLIAIIGTGGGGGGGSGDPCAGPIPCLATDWGGTFYEFRESDGSPIVAMSDGVVFSGGGVNDNGDVVALAGSVSNCYNGLIEVGAIDYAPPDGNIDYTFTSVSGNVNYCNPTLRISNLIIEGTPQPDIVATYVGVLTLFVSDEDQLDRKIKPEVLFDVLDKMYSEQLIKTRY